MGSDVRKYKVVLLGDAGVGKTSLVNMYVNKVFGGKYLKTLGTNIYSKEIIESLDGKEVTSLLQVWDVMGQKVFPSVVKTSLKGASGAIFVCDLTNIESLNNLVTWVQLVFDNCENISLVFLANKSDLDNPAFGFYSVKAGRGHHKRRTKGGFPVGWITTSIVGVVIIWFAVGLFPFHPSLVASGSMQPVMNAGDVVIIAKVPADVIKEGDIIQFRKVEQITVMHRVIKIQETEGAKFFITKGDANDEADTDPVIPQNVVGKLVLTVPKIGWVAIVIKSFFTG